MLLKKCICGKLIPQNLSVCAECEKTYISRHVDYNRNRRNKKAAAFYVSNEWRATRDIILKVYDYIDIYSYYMQQEIVTADMVHHIVELDDDWSRRLDPTNLLPLSNTNHGIISALYKQSEESKRRTQQMLLGLIAKHFESAGGIATVLNGVAGWM